MAEPTSSQPLRRRALPRWAAILGIAVSSIPTAVVVLAFPVANFWVESQWKNLQTQWESEGESLQIESILGPVPSDHENFAHAPLIAEYLRQGPALSTDHAHGHDHSHSGDDHANYREVSGRLGQLDLFGSGALTYPTPKPPLVFATGQPVDLGIYVNPQVRSNRNENLASLRQTFEPIAPLIDELMEAARLPEAHYPINLETPSATQLPHLSALIPALHAIRVHNLLLVESGAESAETAARQLADTLRLIRHGTQSDGLASFSVRTMALESGGLEPVWQALMRQRFNDEQWQAIESELRAFEFGPRLLHSLRFERAALVREVENGFERRSARPFSVPPAWVRLAGLMEYAAMTQRYWFTDGASGRPLVNGPQLPQLAAIEQHAASLEPSLGNMVMTLGVLPVHDFAVKARWVESQRDHALIAIAIERFRLANDVLPENLNALTPDFLSEIPTQVSNHEFPRFEDLNVLGESGPRKVGYQLRSFGEDGESDGPGWIMPVGSIR